MSSQFQWSMLVVGFMLSVLAAHTAKGDEQKAASKDDGKMLQGAWIAVSAASRGRTLPADEVKKIKVIFSGDSVTIENSDKTEKATYALNLNAKPRTIRLTDAMQNSRYGIYEFAGKELKLCISSPRTTPPAKFEAGHELNLVLKKSKD